MSLKLEMNQGILDQIPSIKNMFGPSSDPPLWTPKIQCCIVWGPEGVGLQTRLALWFPTAQSRLALPHRKGSNALMACELRVALMVASCELLSLLPSAHRPFPLRLMFPFHRCPTEHSGTCQVLPQLERRALCCRPGAWKGASQHSTFRKRTSSPAASHPW